MNTTWSFDHILSLAPDAASAKAGQGLAAPIKWQSLGKNERALWGECKGSGANPYRTAIDLTEPSFKCSCPSRKFPCKHGLGLLFLSVSHPGSLQEAPPVDWVSEWLDKRDQREERKKEQNDRAKDSNPDAEAQRDVQRRKAKQTRTAQREEKVRSGIDELQQWMFDLVRQGIAALPTASPIFWSRMASRLIDAQAPGLARRVNAISKLSHSAKDRNEQLTAALGEMQILIEAYNRIDDLPEGVAADVRAEIGWRVKEEDLMDEIGVRDRWLVLGQHTFDEDRLRVHRTWLYGIESQQNALLLNFAAGQKGLEIQFVPEMEFQAELVFFPGNYPLRAIVKERLSPVETYQEIPPAFSIEQLLSSYATALAANPYLALLPAVIGDVLLQINGEEFLLQDSSNDCLPIIPGFPFIWELIALSGGTRLVLFAEWDGEYLLPLSVWAEGRFIRLNTPFSTNL